MSISEAPPLPPLFEGVSPAPLIGPGILMDLPPLPLIGESDNFAGGSGDASIPPPPPLGITNNIAVAVSGSGPSLVWGPAGASQIFEVPLVQNKERVESLN